MSDKKKPREELTTIMHNDLLKNKQADKFSRYMTYKQNVRMFGEEYALEIMGLKKPPKEPF